MKNHVQNTRNRIVINRIECVYVEEKYVINDYNSRTTLV